MSLCKLIFYLITRFPHAQPPLSWLFKRFDSLNLVRKKSSCYMSIIFVFITFSDKYKLTTKYNGNTVPRGMEFTDTSSAVVVIE